MVPWPLGHSQVSQPILLTMPLSQVILEAWVKGVNPKGNSTNPSNWDFGSSFFFAGTVVTTIGKLVRKEGLPRPCSAWEPFQKSSMGRGCGLCRRGTQGTDWEEGR